jgi:septum formation protein
MTSLWIGPPLLLASASPTRRLLLEAVAIPVEQQTPEVDEREIEASCRGLGPDELATRLAGEKARAISRRNPDRLVLGADQVLSCDGRIFHKPQDRRAAESHLSALMGRMHVLHSAAVLSQAGEIVETIVDQAQLTMRPLSPDAIGLYLDMVGERAFTSVGAYQIEGYGLHLFESVTGHHATILGLPLLPLLAALRRQGKLAL